MTMTSKRSHEGYFMMDHRQTKPVPDKVVVATGLPVGSGAGLFEAPTYTCSHCQRVVVLNPNRRRERAYCRKCDHYICDDCGAHQAATGGECKTFLQVVDEILEAAEKKQHDAPPANVVLLHR
jgi:hypothetical protein